MVEIRASEASEVYDLATLRGRVYGDPVPIYFPASVTNACRAFTNGDWAGAVKHLRGAADVGESDASCVLAALYLTGSALLPPNLNCAWELAYPRAVEGNCYAQYLTAWMLEEKKQRTDAVAFMRRSANQNFLPAMVDMGRFCLNGIGMPRNIPEASRWYWQAHRAGHVMGLLLLLDVMLHHERGRLRHLVAHIFLPAVTARVFFQSLTIGPTSVRSFLYDYNRARRLRRNCE